MLNAQVYIKTLAIYHSPFSVYHTFTMNHSPIRLETRTLVFSKKVITFCNGIKITPVTRPMIEQLTKSATSIGANYAEANNASSKTDFRNKIFICKKESKETKYWLRLLARACEEVADECRILWKEAQELTLIFSKIAQSTI